MRKKYFPLIALLSYILATLIIAFWGPIEYIDLNIVMVTGYMLLFLLFFTFGYIYGVNSGAKNRSYRSAELIDKVTLRWVKFCIVITFAYKFQEFAMQAISGGLSLSLSSIGQNYVDTYADYERGSGDYSIGFVLGIFFYLPLLVTIVLGPHYFKSLSKSFKIAVVGVFVLVVVVNTFGQGKQKQLGDLIIMSLSILLLRIGMQANQKKIKSGNKSKKIYIQVILVFAVAFFSFTSVLGSRYQAMGISADNISAKSHPLLQYKLDHPVFTVLGENAGFGTAVLSGYLTQGYLGLSLAFEQPFVWTYGVGSSYSLTMLLQKQLGLSVTPEDTYPYRVGQYTGWGQNKWHSVFPWLASDFTFTGVLGLFFFYALVYARCWKEAVLYRNPISILLFSVLSLGLVFVPANNQLMHSPESLLALFVIIVTWVILHRRMNCLPSALQEQRGSD